MAGLLDFLRRIAPGDAPVDPMAGSVMSRGYIPETSGKQLSLGGIRGLLDVSPVGLADAATQAINRANVPSLVALRAVTGKQTAPGDAMVGLLGQGGGAGYDAARSATQAVVPMMGLLGNQARGALPAGYARDQSGAIVWHGSPHRFAPEPSAPLGRFRADKIGTGEGAQAFGHGFYTSDSQDVARRFMQQAGTYGPMDAFHMSQRAESGIRKLLNRADKANDYAAASVYDELIQGDFTPSGIRSRLASQSLTDRERATAERALKRGERIINSDRGYLYRVDLPDDAIARMLDWDKPFSQQPEAVRRFFEPQVTPIRSVLAKPADPKWGELSAPQAYDPSGAELLQLLGHSDRMDASAVLSGGTGGPLSAARLHAAGIPGIRYLDDGSLGAGAGTSNYVVFPGNEGLLKILERR